MASSGADFDFTQLPCAGIECFRLPVAERKACEARQHPCHAGKYLCRCCAGCSAACGKLAKPATVDQALHKSLAMTADQFMGLIGEDDVS